MKGRIVKNVSNDYTVLVDNQKYVCKPKGVFRKQHITPLVGDFVEIDGMVIETIYPRKNALIRPAVSNIDQALIITSVKQPSFQTDLLDKLLVVIEYNHIQPIICFTKLDLLTREEYDTIQKYIQYYQKIGYSVVTNQELDKIQEILKDQVTVLTGQSGADKSSLLNMLNPNFHIQTGEISIKLDRGKNTTTHAELLPLYGGLVADTPGFTAISLDSMSCADIRDQFIEFNEYRHLCKYKDCMHKKEEQCAIIEKVQTKEILETRYQSYINFISKK